MIDATTDPRKVANIRTRDTPASPTIVSRIAQLDHPASCQRSLMADPSILYYATWL